MSPRKMAVRFFSVLLVIAICFVIFQNFTVDGSKCKVNVTAGQWSYEQRYDWLVLYPSSCGGYCQSPINIDGRGVLQLRFPEPLDLNGYKRYQPNATVANNGHAVSVSVPGDVTVTGGPAADEVFIFYYIHIHFGHSHNNGSEHTVNGISYAMEVHFVHRNNKYTTIDEAKKHPNGLLVISVLAEVVSEIADSTSLNFITSNLQRISEARDSVDIPGPVDLSQLLPGRGGPESYYHYFGSLTTPACQEVVTWVVLSRRIVVSENQMRKFRQLTDDCGEPMADNIRPIQSLNGRYVGHVQLK